METTVTSKEALKNAVAANKYKYIYIEGGYANELAQSVNRSKVGDAASNAAIFVGLAVWPMLIAGVAGKIATKDLKKYKIEEVSENKVTLKIRYKYESKLKKDY